MISDTDLLAMLMQKYPTHEPEFIMSEFVAYKKILDSLEEGPAAEEDVPAAPEIEESAVVVPAPVKKLTKRQIKFDPTAAISQTSITCCVCGKEFKRLSAAHLAMHGATPEEYRKLCGYEPGTPLMGKMIYDRLMRAVKSAQEARIRKRAMTGGTEDL